MRPRVALVGAGSLAGEVLWRLMEEEFPEWERRAFRTREVDLEWLAGAHLVFLATPDEISRVLVPRLAQERCRIVDLSAAFRLREEVPLVIPEINGQVLEDHAGLAANPNCTTSILLMALEPLRRAFGLQRVRAASYQSISGAGRRALEAWENEQKEGEGMWVNNVIPRIGEWVEEGWSQEEWKIREESARIWGTRIPVSTVCVRIPVRRGHALAVFAECVEQPTLEDARRAWERFPGVMLCSEIPHLRDCVGRKEVLVARPRLEGRTVVFWVLGDNLMKGAGWNAVQIAREWRKRGLLP